MVASTSKLALLLATGLSLVAALPAAAPMPTPAAVLPDATIEKRAGSCTFTAASAASASKKSCATIVLSNIAVPSGTTLDLTKLTSGTHVIFQGTTTFGYKEWAGPLISVSGTNINVTGASGSLIDGGGARWWDGQGTNGGKTKPKFFYAHSLTTSSISNLNVINTPVQGFSIDGAKTLAMNSITIDNSAGDTAGGHNTDAFDIGDSTGVTITNANVKNQDDCVAINSGSGITITGATCSGGHGLSIGSVGGRDDNTVSNVLIENSSISNSQNGVRIKTVYGATGNVSGVTYKNIKLSGITNYGIVIEQDYENGSSTGKPTTGVPITGLTVSGVTGTVTSSATEVYILCGSGSCSNWTWTGNSVTGGKKSTKCLNVASGASC
ncbi:Polygalacturonase 1 [Agyrium rufum]|nr:Polygalacturonase 1 [Agyrium rufum]